jgi:hypothetical protein
MARIVTTHYRYGRPPRKKKAIALEVPAIAARASKRPQDKRAHVTTATLWT